MIDLRIDRLRIEVINAVGHEHRMGPVAERAAALLALRVDQRWSAGLRPTVSMNVEAAQAPPQSIDLANRSDDEAAEAIADAWLQGLRLSLKL